MIMVELRLVSTSMAIRRKVLPLLPTTYLRQRWMNRAVSEVTQTRISLLHLLFSGSDSQEVPAMKYMARYFREGVKLVQLEKEADLEVIAELYQDKTIDEIGSTGSALTGLFVERHSLNFSRGDAVVRISWSTDDRVSDDQTRLASSRVAKVGRLVSLRAAPHATEVANGIVNAVSEDGIDLSLSQIPKFVTEAVVGQQNEYAQRRVLFLTKRNHGRLYDEGIRTLSEIVANEAALRQAWLRCAPARVIFGALHGSPIEAQADSGQTRTTHVFNESLQASQRRAVLSTSACNPVSLIHGPPGTGKTTTLAAAVLSAVAEGERVLVTAPSHAACDAVTVALAEHWPKELFGAAEEGSLIRMGHPLRLTDDRVFKFLALQDVQTLQAELLSARDVLRRRKVGDTTSVENLRSLMNAIMWKIRQQDAKHAASLVPKAKVIVCTNSIASAKMQSEHFDLVCFDEAGFVPDYLIMKTLLGAKRIIMCGDHLQLPPVVLSSEAAQKGLETSLFQKLCSLLPENISLLNVQHRSNRLISDWSSQHFYGGLIVAHPSVAGSKLHDLRGVQETAETKTNLLFIDTTGDDAYLENEAEIDKNLQLRAEDESFANFGEALIVEMVLKKYLHLGLRPRQIGLITPYHAQVSTLRSVIGDERVEVRTVDGYQGRQKELIIISLVRSNHEANVGFLRESRRLNVAVTRPRRCCIIVGNSSTLSSDAALRSFVEYCRSHNALVPVNNIFR